MGITISQLQSGLRWLLLSCVVGVGISWSGWNCRSKISATAYTLLGVVCKFISVQINVAIWDKHATPTGLAWLGVCLASSATYRQAPLRSERSNTTAEENSELEPERIGCTETGQDEICDETLVPVSKYSPRQSRQDCSDDSGEEVPAIGRARTSH